MADITNVKLIDLIPDSLKNDKNVLASAQAIQAELDQVSSLLYEPIIVARIDELSSEALDHLAWQYDSKVWRDSWPIKLKRSFIKQVIVEKSTRGTRQSVESALSSLGSSAVIKEWFENSPPSDPHTFSITLSVGDLSGQIDADALADITRKIDNTKPVRSHYTLSLATQLDGKIGAISAARVANYTKLEFEQQKPELTGFNVFAGSAYGATIISSTYPQ